MKYEKSGFPFKQEEDVDPIAAAAARMGENSGDASAEISSVGESAASGMRGVGDSISGAISAIGEKNKENKEKGEDGIGKKAVKGVKSIINAIRNR